MMLYDQNNWFSDNKKITWFSNITYANKFGCPDDFPVLLFAHYHEDPRDPSSFRRKHKKVGPLFFCCVDGGERHGLLEIDRAGLERPHDLGIGGDQSGTYVGGREGRGGRTVCFESCLLVGPISQ